MPSYPLSKLKARVKLGVQRSDVEAASSGYADFVNQAVKELCDKRSWDCMKTQDDFTILQNTKTIALPETFKELQPRNANGSPISYVLNDPSNPGAVFPVEGSFEAQEIRRLWQFGGLVSFWFGHMRAYLKVDSSGAVLGIATPAPEALTFRVDYYGYLPDLEAEGDTSPLAEAYPEMVIAKAKELALASINDAAALGNAQYCEGKFREASAKESHAALAGLNLRM